MPTKLTRIELLFTKAQLDELRLRFPAAGNHKAAVYQALGFDPPKHGGIRPSAGRKPGTPDSKPLAHLRRKAGRPKKKRKG